MKSQIIYSLILSILIHFCCKDENHSTSVEANLPKYDEQRRVEKITYGEDPDSEKTFMYNDDGEIISYFSVIDTVFFHYFKDSIVKVYGNADHQWQSSVTYFLNESGKVHRAILRGKDNGIISEYDFLYNNQGYLSETKQQVFTSQTSYKQTFTYVNGNIKEVVQFDFQGKPYAKYVYSFNENLAAPADIHQHNIIDDFLSKDRLGKADKNLPLSLVNMSMDGDTLSYLKFTYKDLQHPDVLTQIEEDVWNENVMERKYHLSNSKPK